MKHRHPTVLFLSAGLAATALFFVADAAAAGAAVYQWRDAKGGVHYDDQNAARGRRLTRESIDSRKIGPAPRWAGQPTESGREMQVRCQSAQDRDASVSAARTLYVRDRSGRSRALTATQSRGLRAESRRDVARLCSAEATRPAR